MDRYRSMGVRELVVFNFDAKPGKRLRVFDRVRGDLVERVVARETTPSVVLSDALGARCDWVLAPAAPLPIALRLTNGGALVPTAGESERTASARVAELEREAVRLKRR